MLGSTKTFIGQSASAVEAKDTFSGSGSVTFKPGADNFKLAQMYYIIVHNEEAANARFNIWIS